MPQIVDIDLTDLLVDTQNARLVNEQSNQQAALIAIAKHQERRLLKLASDIVEFGLDPTTFPAVIPTIDQRKRYIVIEGNRRIATLKILETPSLVTSVFKNSSDQKKLLQLSERFSRNPITSVKCVLFDPDEEINHWVDLRHTGQNDGIGLVAWGSDEKDRWNARRGLRSPEGQILDFVDQCGLLSDDAKQRDTKIITSVKRFISTPEARKKVGIDVIDKKVVMLYPKEEVAKSLTKLVEDLKTEKIKVTDIYHKADRVNYAESLKSDDLPNPSTRLTNPKKLGEESPNTEKPTSKPKPQTKKKGNTERGVLIPKSCRLNINPPRINTIYNELLTLSVDQYPNACSVALRVFLELSIDHYIEHHALMTEAERRSNPLAKRIKIVASDLHSKSIIPSQLETAIHKVADSPLLLAASTITFNQYVHNPYVFPKASELKVAWDELQPFLEKVWR